MTKIPILGGNMYVGPKERIDNRIMFVETCEIDYKPWKGNIPKPDDFSSDITYDLSKKAHEISKATGHQDPPHLQARYSARDR